MPDFATRLAGSFAEAIDVANMAERIRVHPDAGIHVRAELSVHRVHLIYELAYLRIFNYWEAFLEEVLLRYMCGYTFNGVAEQPVNALFPNVSAARSHLYGNRSYILWHDPNRAVQRANANLQNSRYATVIQPSILFLQQYADVRNRIAHDQDDAVKKFDATTTALVGARFPGSRPGIFLRLSTQFNNSPVKWLERISSELSGLASQLAP